MIKNNFKVLENLKKIKKNYFLFLKKNTNFSNNIINQISYGFQAGTYVDFYNYQKKKKEYPDYYYDHIYSKIQKYIKSNYSILEPGVGEGTFIYELITRNNKYFKNINYFACDYSFSRLLVCKNFLSKKKVNTNLFLSEMSKIGISEESLDIIITHHALEPNRGMEKVIIEEFLNISNKYVILFEPIYELNPKKNQVRMDKYKYVKNLYNICKKLDCDILEYGLLDVSLTPKNLTGIIVLKKKKSLKKKSIKFKCLLTNNFLTKKKDFYYNNKTGIIYPIIKKIPILVDDKAIIAPKI